MSAIVCRMQDSEGRGPYRPGFSHRWSEHTDGPDPVFIAFPGIIDDIRKIVAERGGQAGCAFRDLNGARKWFSANEVLKLTLFGYTLCWIRTDEVLAENTDQLVIWSAIPFAASVVRRGWHEAVSA